jgi:hypothetical protein
VTSDGGPRRTARSVIERWARARTPYGFRPSACSKLRRCTCLRAPALVEEVPSFGSRSRLENTPGRLAPPPMEGGPGGGSDWNRPGFPSIAS